MEGAVVCPLCLTDFQIGEKIMRRNIASWDDTFMKLAMVMADHRSKDPNTQVGCVIVNADKDPVAFGYNGFGGGSEENDELWKRPEKYDHVIHAEANAIGRAAKRGCSTDGCTAYVTAFPCLSCAKQLIAAGIKKVVAYRVLHGWDEDHRKAAVEFKRNGIPYNVMFDG
jgi:dCMP deaminase